MTDRAQVESALALVEADWGVPDLLVNAAAIDAPPDAPAAEVGPFEDVPVESLERVVHVNVLGVVVPCQVIGGAMARAGRGSIVNVGSVYGLLSPDQGLYDFRREAGEAFYKPVAYSVSKSALVNLTRYLATYWGRSGVRVNTLTPHGIENGQPAPFVEAFAARSPLGRLMDVSEAVGAVVFLASDALVVRHRGEPRRRRRLVGLVIPAEVPNLVAGEERPPASGAWLEKTRPADGADLCRVARSGSADADAAVAAAREAQVEWGARTAVERGDVVRAIAALLRERREEASEIVAAETGKGIELARGETDAADRDGLLRRGRGPPLVRAHDDGVDAASNRADPATAGRRRGPPDLVQHAAAERRLEGVPVDLLRQRLGAEAVGAHARVGMVARPALPRGRTAAGRAERRPGARAGGGDAARRGPARRSRLVHRLGRHRPAASPRQPDAVSRRP